MDAIKSANILANTLLFPGSIMKSSYDHLTYANTNSDSMLIYIPFKSDYIPAILVLANINMGSLFCIHFHGNACDSGQIVKCALKESQHFNAHYLIVEYPRYGIMHGFSSEHSIDFIAKVVYDYVTTTLDVDSSRIVLIGRSIGCGPVCRLASHLERSNQRPAAVILQSPYCSLKDAAYDLVGNLSLLLLERWENWRYLCGDYNYTHTNNHIGDNNSKNNNTNHKNTIVTVNNNHIEESHDIKNGQYEEKEHLNNQSSTSNTMNESPNPSKSISTHTIISTTHPSQKKSFLLFSNNELIKCPVLMIHADQDTVIDYQHAVMLHECRLQTGYISELHTQKSTIRFKKGHNQYEFHNDYIVPTKIFLKKYVTDFTQTITPQSQYVVSLPMDVLYNLTIIPLIYSKPTPIKKLNMISGCLWCMCPITVCMEGCLAMTCCSSHSCTSLCCNCHSCICYNNKTRFNYQLRKQYIKQQQQQQKHTDRGGEEAQKLIEPVTSVESVTLNIPPTTSIITPTSSDKNTSTTATTTTTTSTTTNTHNIITSNHSSSSQSQPVPSSSSSISPPSPSRYSMNNMLSIIGLRSKDTRLNEPNTAIIKNDNTNNMNKNTINTKNNYMAVSTEPETRPISGSRNTMFLPTTADENTIKAMIADSDIETNVAIERRIEEESLNVNNVIISDSEVHLDTIPIHTATTTTTTTTAATAVATMTEMATNMTIINPINSTDSIENQKSVDWSLASSPRSIIGDNNNSSSAVSLSLSLSNVVDDIYGDKDANRSMEKSMDIMTGTDYQSGTSGDNDIYDIKSNPTTDIDNDNIEVDENNEYQFGQSTSKEVGEEVNQVEEGSDNQSEISIQDDNNIIKNSNMNEELDYIPG